MSPTIEERCMKRIKQMASLKQKENIRTGRLRGKQKKQAALCKSHGCVNTMGLICRQCSIYSEAKP